jgi:hypothetical protein
LPTLQWLLTTVAVLLAAAALLKARRASRRLERLAESYWELHYEVGQLRARVGRLEGAPSDPGPGPAASQGSPANFVPLASLKQSRVTR